MSKCGTHHPTEAWPYWPVKIKPQLKITKCEAWYLAPFVHLSSHNHKNIMRHRNYRHFTDSKAEAHRCFRHPEFLDFRTSASLDGESVKILNNLFPIMFLAVLSTQLHPLSQPHPIKWPADSVRSQNHTTFPLSPLIHLFQSPVQYSSSVNYHQTDQNHIQQELSFDYQCPDTIKTLRLRLLPSVSVSLLKEVQFQPSLYWGQNENAVLSS